MASRGLLNGGDDEYVQEGVSESAKGFCGRWRQLDSQVRVGAIVLGLVAVVGGIVGLVLGVDFTGGSPQPTFSQYPVVVNTWWDDVTASAWSVLNESYPAMDAVEVGCSFAERMQKDTTVGFGGSPDTNGEVTLDALIMDGSIMDIGAVGYLRDVKQAITTARRVMTYTRHTMLAGDGARDFAVMTGLDAQSLSTNVSDGMYASFLAANCTPNYYQNIVNNVTGVSVNASCGPYEVVPTPAPTPYPAGALTARARRGARSTQPGAAAPSLLQRSTRKTTPRTRQDHDTVGMCALDAAGNIALGMSSNGARYKVAGRIGDAPLVGAGGYASNEGGCAAATGDGDITARFLPAFVAVENMRRGMSPEDACTDAIQRIVPYYPVFDLGLVCMDRNGRYGAASHGWTFTYCFAAPDTQGVSTCKEVQGMKP